jgi:hypothetical protein
MIVVSAAQEDCSDAPDVAASRPHRDVRAASMSALEEALRQALESASREQVIQRVIAILPESATAESARGAWPKPGLHGKVQKVSVSLPTELTDAVRARTGAGGFSRYVTEAVQQRMRLDLLDDLSAELAAEFGPVGEELVRQAMAEWPDYQPE